MYEVGLCQKKNCLEGRKIKCGVAVNKKILWEENRQISFAKLLKTINFLKHFKRHFTNVLVKVILYWSIEEIQKRPIWAQYAPLDHLNWVFHLWRMVKWKDTLFD